MDLTNLNKDRKLRRKPSIDMGSMVYGKLPPQAKDLEEAVLGAIMLEKSAQGDALRQTSPFVGNITEEQRMAVLEQYRRVWEGEISYEEAKKLTASER